MMNTMTSSAEVVRALSSLEAAETEKLILVRSVLRRLNPRLRAGEEHGECEMRASRLLRKGSAGTPYLIAQRRKGDVAAWFSISRALPESWFSWFCLNHSIECVMLLSMRATTIRLLT